LIFLFFFFFLFSSLIMHCEHFSIFSFHLNFIFVDPESHITTLRAFNTYAAKAVKA